MTTLDFARDEIPGRVVFGAGSRRRLADEADRAGAERILVIASIAEELLADELSKLLGDRVVGRFSDVVQHVPIAKAEEARAMVRDTAADTVVTIGGGSATGLGKAIALEIDVVQIAVPTTYAGSEMTTIWGLTDGDHKMTGKDARVKPAVVVYDPELTLGLPPAIAGPSGMNALAHCVEALYASRRRSGHGGARARRCAGARHEPAPGVQHPRRSRRARPARSSAPTSPACRWPRAAPRCTTRRAMCSAACSTSTTAG